MSLPKENLKIVLLGKTDAGKTTLLKNQPVDGSPLSSVTKYQSKEIHRKDKILVPVFWELQFWTRNLDNALVIVLVMDLSSYSSVVTTWKEIASQIYLSRTAVILVGTKIDLREKADTLDDEDSPAEFSESKARVLTREDGERYRQWFNAISYFETSSVTGEGVAQFFEAAIATAVKAYDENNPPPASSGCCEII